MFIIAFIKFQCYCCTFSYSITKHIPHGILVKDENSLHIVFIDNLKEKCCKLTG